MSTSFTSGTEDRSDVIVFCHGLGCDRTYWKDALNPRITPYLAPFDKYSFDWPGHGDNAHSTNPATIDSYADELSSDFDAWSTEYERVHVVSHSMGTTAALIAWDQTLRGSNAEGSFISIEGNLTGSDCGLLSRDIATGTRTVDEIRHELRSGFSTSAQAWAAMFDRCDSDAVAMAARSLVEWCDGGTLVDRWQRLKTPVYIIGGYSIALTDHTALFTDTNTIVVTVPRAGHFPMVDEGPTLWRSIRTYL